MPSKKKKSKAGKPKHPGVPKALVAILALLLIAGVAAVKYLQTRQGRVFLLDAGFHSYYAQVQEQIGDALEQGLEEFGLEDSIEEKAGFARAGGKTIRYLEWKIACGPGSNLVLINVTLSRAVHEAGGRVRRSEEIDGGQTLLFDVGSGKYDTHRLVLQKVRIPVAQPMTKPPRLALVIDDMGYSRNSLTRELLELDLPLTFSILPSLPHSAYVLEQVRKTGKNAILHLPMEPVESRKSDMDEVTTEMQNGQIEKLVEEYLRTLPGVVGVNNHQGSLATTDRRVMEAVLGVIKRHGLYFMDSLTSSKSVAYNTAKDLGVPAVRNDLFFDADTKDPEVVGRKLRRLVSVAEKHGVAVGIGHPRSWTLEALKNNQDYLKNAGIELVFLSEVVD